MNQLLNRHTFTNADQEIVPYDGSPVMWRISAYALVQRAGTSGGNEILIIKDKFEKLYDVVGGGIELGETIAEGLQREALEEAGANISIGQFLHLKQDWFCSQKEHIFYQTLQLFYEATLVGKLQKPTELDVVWRDFVPMNEIGTKYPVPSVVAEVILKIKS